MFNHGKSTKILSLQVDLLKSALEINHKVSNPMLRKGVDKSDHSLSKLHADSAPKLYNHHSTKNIAMPALIGIVDELSVVEVSCVCFQITNSLTKIKFL